PIRRSAFDHARCRRIERTLYPEGRGAIGTEFPVDPIVPHRVPRQPSHLLPECTVDERGRTRGRSYRRAAVGEAPGGRAVPDVLHGGVVVHAEAEGRALGEDAPMGREAEIGVVDSDLTALRIERDLQETTHV